MFVHYLKIALRNLIKYKTQNLVSIVALAVGVVTLAVVHFVMGFLREPPIMDEPYAERCHILTFKNLDTSALADNGVGRPAMITKEMMAKFTSLEGLASAERIMVTPVYYLFSNFTFTLPDSTKKNYSTNFYLTPCEYPNFRAMRSAVTGEKIPVLKNNEIVLPEYEARRIFGNKNPIGAQVWIEWFDGIGSTNYIVRDIYKVNSTFEFYIMPAIFVPCDEDAQYYNHNLGNQGHQCQVQLREGYTLQQLIDEVNGRLRPLGVEVGNAYPIDYTWKKNSESIYLTRPIIYIVGSLVLLASLIGFLKMQLQLFNMRRREVALRKVHGAGTKSLFALFFTEVAIMLALSFILAVVMSLWLTEYVEKHLAEFFQRSGLLIEGTGVSLAVIIVLVAVVCVVAVWLSLSRILNMQRGVAAAMHRSRGHAVRNTMLGLQLIVGVLFLGAAVVIVQAVGLIKEAYNVPDNDESYKNGLLVETAKHSPEDDFYERLQEYIVTEAEGVKCCYFYDETYSEILSLSDNPKAKDIANYYRTFYFDNESFLELWQHPVKWIRPEVKGEAYILLSEELYKRLDDLGLLQSGTLQLYSTPPLPIAGTYKNIPYCKETHNMVYVKNQPLSFLSSSLVIMPEDGEYANVYDEIKAEIRRLNPSLVLPNIYNLREKLASQVHIFENMERAAWILSLVSIVICIMGIYSSISLDTRSRMKEVAVRKVHGAKKRDVIVLFCRLYMWLFAVAAVVSLPLIILFTAFIKDMTRPLISGGQQLSPLLAFAAALFIILFVVALIVGYHIRKVMRLNPSQIIAKE